MPLTTGSLKLQPLVTHWLPRAGSNRDACDRKKKGEEEEEEERKERKRLKKDGESAENEDGGGEKGRVGECFAFRSSLLLLSPMPRRTDGQPG